MVEDVQGLPTVSVSPAPSGKVESSTLPNGIKVVSTDAQGAVGTISFQVKAGSRYEQVPGTARFLEYLAYKRTSKRTSAKLAYDIEAIGATLTTAATKETLTFTGSALRDSAGDVIGTIAESLLQPALKPYEVDEEKEGFLSLLSKPCKVTSALAELHAAAYGRASPLGHFDTPSPSGLDSIDVSVLKSHLGSFVTAGAITVAGTNISHKALVELVGSAVSGVPAAGAASLPASPYEGGYSETRQDTATVTLAVGFPAPPPSSPAAADAQILAALLSTPSLSVSYLPYTDSALLTFTATAPAPQAATLLANIAAVTKAAKAASAESISFASLSAQLSQAIAAQGTLTGAPLLATATSFGLPALSSSSPSSVSATAASLFSQPVSVGAVGNTTYIPSYPKIAAIFA